ncbi:MAG TPA: alpha/beta hydrolase, partial [Acidisoma sp.]|uniref:alpha/beta hydrolase n=1 Tax=Acidisoma sp. TaxID=1872115 RepID=UPI002D00A540
MRRTIPPAPLFARLRAPIVAMGLALSLAGCAVPHPDKPLPPIPPVVTDGAFTMSDGVRLPYREWLPPGEPGTVVLALHGIDDSRDAWEKPGPLLAAQGIAVIAPDERGFGATADRGVWPGTAQMLADARAMALDLRLRYPDARL